MYVFADQCDVFILITKYDRVRDSEETSLIAATHPENSVSIKEFEEVENGVKEEFCIVGASEHKMFRWVSLSDSTGYENAEVDKNALNFLWDYPKQLHRCILLQISLRWNFLVIVVLTFFTETWKIFSPGLCLLSL